MTTPFDILNAINSKRDILKEDESTKKDYIPFMINRGLSYFPDTIFLANEMNKHPELDKDIQFYFYFNAVSKRKRFSKWSKKSVRSDTIELISKCYECSLLKAEEYERLLSAEQLDTINAKFNYGGKND